MGPVLRPMTRAPSYTSLAIQRCSMVRESMDMGYRIMEACNLRYECYLNLLEHAQLM